MNTVGDLTERGVGLEVLAGEGASIDTTTANGRRVFAIFAGLAEFERELIVERTKGGLAYTVTPDGQIRPDGEKLLARRAR